MITTREDEFPEYVLERLDGATSFGKTLLVEGTLCAIAFGLLAALPGSVSRQTPELPQVIVENDMPCSIVQPARWLDDEERPSSSGRVPPRQQRACSPDADRCLFAAAKSARDVHVR